MDQNTKFFHQRASTGKQKNSISSLVDDSGLEHTENEAIGKLAMDYFRNMFSSANPPLILQALEDFHSHVTDDMNMALRAEYREKEVDLAFEPDASY